MRDLRHTDPIGRWFVTGRRRAVAIAATVSLLTLTGGAAAYADNLQPDGDRVTVDKEGATLAMGNICIGQTTPPSGATPNLTLSVTRNGNYVNANVFRKGSAVTVSIGSVTVVTSPSGFSGGFDMVNPTISIPADWDSALPNTLAGTATGRVQLAPSHAGAIELRVPFTAVGVDSADDPLTRGVTLTVTANAVDCTPAPADTTAPTSSATGATGTGAYTFGDWASSDVTLTLTGQDENGGSGLKEIRYTTDGSTPTAGHGQVYDPADRPVISTEGTTTVRYVAVDNAGNVEAPVNTAVVRLDKTVPVITDDSVANPPSGEAGTNGWYTSDVVVTFRAADGLSGFTGKPDPHTFTATTSGEGNAVTVASGTVADVAGNLGTSVDSAPVQVDLTDPGVNCAAAPTFVLGSTGQQVSATVTDDTSGPAAATVTADADTSSVGTHNATVTGHDNAGRSTQATCSYRVVYDWSGFFKPIDNLPVLNSVKAGSAVPVKFSLGGDQGLDVMATGYPRSTVISCDSTADTDAVEQTVTAGSSSLSYDPATGQYNYVWKTDKVWAGTCRQLVVQLDDGTYHRANFKLLK